MQRLERSCTPGLYIGRKVLKGKNCVLLQILHHLCVSYFQQISSRQLSENLHILLEHAVSVSLLESLKKIPSQYSWYRT